MVFYKKIILFALFFSFSQILLSAVNDSVESNSALKVKQELIELEIAKFRDLITITDANYIDSISIAKSSDAAFNSYLKALDIQSEYYSPEVYKQLKQQQSGAIAGIGAYFISIRDTAIVSKVYPNSPADSAGLRFGDILMFANSQALFKKNETEINSLVNGEPNTIANLIIKRDGKLIEFQIRRAGYQSSSLAASFIEKKYGYIKASGFNANSNIDFKNKLTYFKKQGINKIIIDLRGNGGGYLDQVSQIATNFLKKGDTIIKTKTTNAAFKADRFAEEDGEFQNFQITVLVDKETASASEILAGVVQDYDLGEIIGEITYGKGTVQNWWEFKDGSAFRITVAEYLTPSGRPINKKANSSNFNMDELRLQLGDKNLEEIKPILGILAAGGKVPIFKSAKGKSIIALGGIYPDIRVNRDTLTPLTTVLNDNRTIHEFIYDLVGAKLDSLKSAHKSFARFANDFQITDQDLENLKQYSLRRNIWNEQMYIIDKEAIRTLIKARIAEAIWGDDAYWYCQSQNDNTYKKAVN